MQLPPQLLRHSLEARAWTHLPSVAEAREAFSGTLSLDFLVVLGDHPEALLIARSDLEARLDGELEAPHRKIPRAQPQCTWGQAILETLGNSNPDKFWLGSAEAGALIDTNSLRQEAIGTLDRSWKGDLERDELVQRAGEQFLANLSHELRTPLGAILGLADVLGGTGLDSEQAELLDALHRSGRTLLRLVDDLLEFTAQRSGLTAVQKVPFDPFEVLSRLAAEARSLAGTRQLEFHQDLDPDLPARVLGDAQRLRQALWPLLDNALRFTQKGWVELTARRQRSAADRPLLVVEIRDSGPGIPREQQARLRQVFAQGDGSAARQHGGAGIGLALSSLLLEALGAQFELESSPGQGSLMRVTLELEVLYERGSATPKESANSDLERLFEALRVGSLDKARLRVLVVDDNPINRRVAQALIRRSGHSCELAENGQAALERARQGSLDLILMDCQMPLLDGYEATRLIREAQPEPRPTIIALTAHTVSGDRERALAAGMDGYLIKPLGDPLLARALALALEHRGKDQAAERSEAANGTPSA